ncbi:radical sam [Lucifera butyrica]|uniref:Radical sam n=1 Tax=Lucifera butyrica TaxID=1351585 RepID=A0A498RA44_9FIRM|nr:radical SAM protein [Lucifera butyrica]VBB09566.1 radical sam [Lucifera butyrica]
MREVESGIIMGDFRRHTEDYNFVGDPNTGITFRWGESLHKNPVCAPWPELADISISNYCTKQCKYCYRASSPDGTFISLEDYSFILEQLTSKRYGPVFQVALGGGEPLLHPQITEILRLTRKEYNIIPNYTTSGFFFTPEIIQATGRYCGAVAVSYDPYRRDMTWERLNEIGTELADEGIKVNIHFVVSDSTVDAAANLLEGYQDNPLNRFNSIIFLTYKPFGKANVADCLKPDDRLRRFLALVENPGTKLQFGFDACFVPLLFRKTKVNFELLDSCECGFFSVYIDERLDVSPCSFCNERSYKFSLRQYNFADIWENEFQKYRQKVLKNCPDNCAVSDICRGKCEFFEELFICPVI